MKSKSKTTAASAAAAMGMVAAACAAASPSSRASSSSAPLSSPPWRRRDLLLLHRRRLSRFVVVPVVVFPAVVVDRVPRGGGGGDDGDGDGDGVVVVDDDESADIAETQQRRNKKKKKKKNKRKEDGGGAGATGGPSGRREDGDERRAEEGEEEEEEDPALLGGDYSIGDGGPSQPPTDDVGGNDENSRGDSSSSPSPPSPSSSRLPTAIQSILEQTCHYDVLGITRSASLVEIRKAYRRRCVLTHPDKAPGGDRTAFDKVSEAYDVLGSEEKRATYDRYEGVFASHDDAHHREDGGVSENGASSIGDGDDEYPTNTIVFYHLSARYRPAWRALDLISEGLPRRLSRGRIRVTVSSLLSPALPVDGDRDSIAELVRPCGCVSLAEYLEWRDAPPLPGKGGLTWDEPPHPKPGGGCGCRKATLQ